MPSLINVALEGYRAIPRPVLRRLLGTVLGEAHVALCMHRVRFDEPPAENAENDLLTIEAARLDALIELLLESRRTAVRSERWLVVTFDDGYADAFEYVSSRSDRYRNVEWLLFVCPEKIRKGAGFRWDLMKEQGQGVHDIAPLSGGFDVCAENDREELQALSSNPCYRLASRDECLRIRERANVEIGNHTNSHFALGAIALEQGRADLLASTNDFRELFGTPRHFAFPFGTPGSEFKPEHVEMARDLGYEAIWTTEPRPFDPEERVFGALLPRFAPRAHWDMKKMAWLIVLAGAKWRMREGLRRVRSPEAMRWRRPSE